MCTPLALGIAAGGASAVTGIMQQNRAHRAQVDAVNRSNQIARQKYLNDITISAFNDRQKGQVFTAQLQADAASRAAFYKQKEFNQIEANRASESAQQELREASGQAAGQSTMLSLDQAERELGYAQAQLDASVFDATKAYGIKQFGVNLDQFSSDVSAYNRITTTAPMAPAASFMTMQPIEQAPPPKPSILTPILGGFVTGVQTGFGVKAALKK